MDTIWLRLSPSWTYPRRLHFAELGMAMGVLDLNHGYYPLEYLDVLLHARIKSPNNPGKEGGAPEETTRTA